MTELQQETIQTLTTIITVATCSEPDRNQNRAIVNLASTLLDKLQKEWSK